LQTSPEASQPKAEAPLVAGRPDVGLDHSFLADMRKRRPQLFERLLTAYLTHSPKNIRQLLDAVAGEHAEALYLAAHSLKSSSANVGATRVADLARQIEAKSRNGSLEGIAPVAEDLRIAFQHTQDAMRLALEQAKTGT
jgi:HPt (histidine-containing phosphotransfer) domain-containing protein